MSKRGSRRASMRVRLAVAAAVLVGGGAAGAAAVATSHSGPTTAESAGYYTSSPQLTESQGMSEAMNWWSRSPQTSLTVITKIVTIKTIAVTQFHTHTIDVQRGTVVAVSPWEFVVKSSNNTFQVWHTNKGANFFNVGDNKTGWQAMSGSITSSYGSYDWSNSANSMWSTSAKTIAPGDVVFVFGEKVDGELWAQLVLFAAPSSSSYTSSTSTPWDYWSSSTPNYTKVNGKTVESGTHS